MNSKSSPEKTVYPSPMWSTWTRRAITIILLIAGTYTIKLLTPVLPLIVTCLIATFILFSPARAITRRLRIPYAFSVVLIYLILLLFFLFILLVFIPSLANWISSFVQSVEPVYQDLQIAFKNYQPADGIIKILGAEIDLDPVIQPIRGLIVEEPNQFFPSQPSFERPDNKVTLHVNLQAIINGAIDIASALGVTLSTAIPGAISIVVQLGLVQILTFFMLLEVPRAHKAFFDLIPPGYHREFAILFDRIFFVWSRFIRGQIAIGILIGLLTWLQLRLMGIPGAGILAFVTGLLSPVPVIGTPLTLIPLAIAPLLQGSILFIQTPHTTLALLIVVINFALQQLIWTRISRISVYRVVSLPLPVLVAGLFVGISIGGIAGALLVPPILGTLRVIFYYLANKLSGQDPYPNQTEPALHKEGLFTPIPFWGYELINKIKITVGRVVHPPAPQ